MTAAGRLGPLRERAFARLFAATMVSSIGDWASIVALGFGVLAFGSATDLGVVLLARSVPGVLFVLAGGVSADRFSRRRVIAATDLARAVAQAGGAIVLTQHAPSSLALAGLAALHGAAGAFSRPAMTGFVSDLVRDEQLQPANALMSLSRNSVALVGSAAGAILVGTVGASSALALDSASFLFAAMLVLGIPIQTRAPRRGTSPLADYREGWREFRSRTWLWVTVASFACFQLAFIPSLAVLGPLVSKQHLGGPKGWAAILTLDAIGALGGGALALRLAPRRPLVFITLVAFPSALYLALLGVAHSLAVVAAGALVSGIGISLSDPLWFTILQRHIPGEALSRVSSFDWLGSTALTPVGFALVGPLAGTYGARAVLLSAAALIVGSGLVVISVSSVRNLPLESTESPNAST